MKKNTFVAVAATLALTVAVLMSGCGNSGSAETQNNESVAEVSANVSQTADLSDASTITVSDNETVTITKEGVYTLTGSAANACVVVEAGDDDKVQLILDNVSIINSDQPCILVENADKVLLLSSEGSSNTLSVSGQFSGDADAVIYSRDDLELDGLGTVTISSAEDGICSNDDLELLGGTWTVTASDTAMKAHDSIIASSGTFDLTAGNDGLHAEDNDGADALR